AVIELRSNTMQMGIHDDELVSALKPADNVVLYQPPTSSTSFDSITDRLGPSAITYNSVELIVSHIIQEVRTGDVVVIMSNGGFGGLRGLLSQRLSG
ncbi:MAG TPA: UDP-N-acetylmuramate:L-alanyl-gamma-D-glutamyl-meso-diaminopimelate ligase, partial [Gammaproteobacteria bacterium]|nr:UDP-N-acetylmuramate:L-alanyl-gamma-D-glutamyl-meso-diaminopimelate ligase [Gammaproteobacteria bacterium]